MMSLELPVFFERLISHYFEYKWLKLPNQKGQFYFRFEIFCQGRPMSIPIEIKDDFKFQNKNCFNFY
jgi:hypothetical protein